jgi:hypothetical protein
MTIVGFVVTTVVVLPPAGGVVVGVVVVAVVVVVVAAGFLFPQAEPAIASKESVPTQRLILKVCFMVRSPARHYSKVDTNSGNCVI